MARQTIMAGSRTFGVTPATAQMEGFPYIELGPGNTSSSTGGLLVQFNPSENFVGDFAVLGRTMGQAAMDLGTPFVPIPYRVGSLNNVAQVTNGIGWPWSVASISTSAIVWIPTNGLTIVLLDGLTEGRMDLTAWDLQGAPAL
jgi:hypothetical protein